MPKLDAIIIASRNTSASLPPSCEGCRSLIPLNGKPAVQWVIEALRETDSVQSITVTGPSVLTSTNIPSMVDRFLPEQSSEIQSLLETARTLSDSTRALVVTGNMSLVTSDALKDFAGNCTEGDVVYATVTKRSILTQFPDSDNWTYMKAIEGEVTGSSALLFRPMVFEGREDTLKKIFAARNDASELIKICGMGIALKYAMGQLSLADVEKRISEALRIDGRSYISPFAELAFEVDDARDAELCESMLTERARMNVG